MKVGLLITCFNRPDYLEQCLWSLERADLSQVDAIVVIDDASDNHKTISLVNGTFNRFFANVYRNNSRLGIRENLRLGYHVLFAEHGDIDIVINLDGDALVKPNFVNELLRLHELHPNKLITGFHSTTKNKNGTERHKIIKEAYNEGYCVKSSVGGINMLVTKETYQKHVLPALQTVGNWDHNACLSAGEVVCAVPSLVQHLGIVSSMGHDSDNPDVADDFYYYDLPNVTLIGVDSDLRRLNEATKKCTEYIRFGDVKLLNPGLTSKEAYSKFVIKELYKYFDTDYCLIFQHDGFVHNWKAWDNEFLKYDYIGAPWHYKDGMAVGNGGFSLRSKRLMQYVAQNLNQFHPEDHHICRTFRPQLEQAGFKFAPIEIAERFSFEGWMQPDKQLKDQFGKHGLRVTPQPRKNAKYIFNQFKGLGDILFLVPMARALMEEGNTVLWPIADDYFDISKHFPDINFVKQSALNVPYDFRGRFDTPHGTLLPYRFAMELQWLGMDKIMQSKYTLYGHDWKMWRNLHWQRFHDKEQQLIERVGAKGKFNLVNRYYAAPANSPYQIEPEITNDYPVIEMTTISGFTLIDWLGVIEKATEIHVANSSIMYLLELMELQKPTHVYKRNIWNENGFEHTRELWTNPNFIFHH